MGLLPYETVQKAEQPEAVLLEFLQSGGVKAAGWDEASLAALL